MEPKSTGTFTVLDFFPDPAQLLAKGRSPITSRDAESRLTEHLYNQNPQTGTEYWLVELELWMRGAPFHAEAYLTLADCFPQYDEALTERAIVAGKVRLDQEAGDDEPCYNGIYGISYLRARARRARRNAANWKLELAVSEMEEILALDPNDRNGMRNSLIRLLFNVGDNEAAAAAIEAHGKDGDVTALYGIVFLAWRAEYEAEPAGFQRPEAERMLAEAMKLNACVPAVLLEHEMITKVPSEWTLGGLSEAVEFAHSMRLTWMRNPTFCNWIFHAAGRLIRSGLATRAHQLEDMAA